MKKFLLFFALLVATTAWVDGYQDYREGDIVFQISKSKQSPLIQYATMSPWSHCGIIVMKGDQPYVLEASNVVKLTPIDEWVNRGRFGKSVRYRYTDKPLKVRYQKYLGTPYDLQFSLTNSKYYCSELVWLIYKEQFGVELCQPRPLSDYHTLGLEKVMKRRGICKKSLFIAPSDLKQSKLLHHVN